ncbi:hypothetical protein BWI17_14025 [Betaproteobacteria bacterium GR16-43]|nr:hypothetical protein BWI17_14025 [Betaproteobacteria bacterium GR16-43]
MAEREPLRCLVLGGSGYVGSAVCRALHAEGARVAFTFRSRENEARVLERELPGSRAIALDFASHEAVGAVVDSLARDWGGLDALVQCAGTAGNPALYRNDRTPKPDKFLDIDAPGWHEMMDVTVGSTFAACQAAVRAMTGGGQIVVVGSMDGVKSVPAPVHYAASKGALRAMVTALAHELGKRRILVNMVAPGLLDGGMAKLLSDDLLADYVKHCSLKRTGTAAEMAELVAWLVMENTYVTGQSILLDGGL